MKTLNILTILLCVVLLLSTATGCNTQPKQPDETVSQSGTQIPDKLPDESNSQTGEQTSEGLTVADFTQFKAGVTTWEQVHAAVGMPDDMSGSGFVEEIYFTDDENIILVCYDSDNTVYTVSKCKLENGQYLITEPLIQK